jgi:valyl-tRNA synthetase
MIAPWPEPGQLDEAAEQEMELIMDIVRQVRTVRSEYKADPGKYISASIAAGPNVTTIEHGAEIIRRLARLQPLAVHNVMAEKPERAVALLVGTTTVYLPLEELTDIQAERERLSKELDGAARQEAAVAAKLANDSFTSRAPAAVVEREQARCQELRERIRRLEERLQLLGD